MKHTLLSIINCCINMFPETRLYKFKTFLLKLAGVRIGKNVRICSSVKIIGSGELSIGDNTWIGPQVLISASSEIVIGKNVDIAPRVTLVDGSHLIDHYGAHLAGKGTCEPIYIGDGSWICACSLLLGGTKLEAKTLVAAGAVVRGGSYEGNSMIGGVPAKFIKSI